jgi:hypothetical protein
MITIAVLLVIVVVILVTPTAQLVYGQTLPPATLFPPGTLPTSENRTEQKIICSGFSYTCG